MAPNINGKFKLTDSEHFDDYMKALGVSMMTRTLANKATPVQEITQDGETINIKTVTTFKTTEIKFKIGEEFDEQTADGRKVKTTFAWEGDKLVQTQVGDKTTTLTREFNGDELVMICKVDNIVCTRKYKKTE